MVSFLLHKFYYIDRSVLYLFNISIFEQQLCCSDDNYKIATEDFNETTCVIILYIKLIVLRKYLTNIFEQDWKKVIILLVG